MATAFTLTLPTTLPTAAALPGTVKDALPALTVMMANGAVNFLEATIILVAGWTIARYVGRWTRNLLDSIHIDETLKPLFANFARYAILGVTIVAVLGQFGVQTTSLIALVGAAGLALGLALQGTLSNVASGVMLLFLRPFRVAERITIADTGGTVREIGLFRTALVTDEGLFVSIPNSTIFSGIIVNTSRERIRRTGFTVDIDRSENIAETRKLILAAMAADQRVLKSPPPDVQVESILGSTVVMSVQVWVNNRDFGGQQADLKRIVRQALEAAHVSPPIPIPPPAVAPWTPQPDNTKDVPDGKRQTKPN
jgi:small conductance mechanosensitive channel